MRLLIITQKVDANDDLLGFFAAWIREFSRLCDTVHVICLEKGDFDFPQNVFVHSLGKESRKSRRLYLYNFFRFIFSLRNEYDAVFVHMNPVYVVLGGLWWRLWAKPIILWYVHPKTNFYLRLALVLVHKVLTASCGSFPIVSRKVVATGHGIDTEIFSPNASTHKIPNSVLYVGRISPVKNLVTLAETAHILDKGGFSFTFSILGGRDARFSGYYEDLQENLEYLISKGTVKFLPQVPNREIPQFYWRHEILVNLTASGSFDKTVLEAMASGTLVLAASSAFVGVLPENCMAPADDANAVADKLKRLLGMSSEEKRALSHKLREYVVSHHNVKMLIKQIVQLYASL